MMKERIENTYFNWMQKLVMNDGGFERLGYQKLLRHLHGRTFIYRIDMDGNREGDGIDLRYRFGQDAGYPQTVIANFLDIKPCSVLEMMVALAFRCEERIACDPDAGDRTGFWFWDMIKNLGLDGMSDIKYDARKVDKVIDIFLYRKYRPDGTGGLFVLKEHQDDLRTVEIWYQMMWYLDEKLEV